MRMKPIDWAQVIANHNHTVVVSLLARGLRLSDARQVAVDTWSLLYERHAAGLIASLEFPGLAVRQAGFLASNRSKHKTVSFEHCDAANLLASETPAADEVMVSKQALCAAQAAFSQLPPRAKQVYAFHLQHPNTDHASLAAQLGLSLQRFRQTLCEVRARLKVATRRSAP